MVNRRDGIGVSRGNNLGGADTTGQVYFCYQLGEQSLLLHVRRGATVSLLGNSEFIPSAVEVASGE